MDIKYILALLTIATTLIVINNQSFAQSNPNAFDEKSGTRNIELSASKGTSDTEYKQQQSFNNTNEDTNSTQPKNISNTFEDPNLGISLSYPPDWRMASKEYMDMTFGYAASSDSSSPDASPTGTLKPIVYLLPETLNGATFSMVTEELPFPISAETYLEMNKRSMQDTAEMKDVTPISVGDLKGYRYNLVSPDGLLLTQMLFVKDSKGLVIAYVLGAEDQEKNQKDINSIIDSLVLSKT